MPERLEGRELMAFSNLGFSLPQLMATGSAGPRAAWGGTLSVNVYLQNIGASTTTEPTAQAPGATSQADAADSTVAVLLTPSAHSLRGAVTLGQIQAPPVPQNNFEQLAQSFTLPSRPKGFAGTGGRFFVRFETNSNGALLQASSVNTYSRPVPVAVVGRALPQLQVIGFFGASGAQQGDSIITSAQIENLGTAAANGVEVALVLSTEPFLTAAPDIIAAQLVNIPSVSQTPTSGDYRTFAMNSVFLPSNVVTVNFATVTLPISPSNTPYYLGVVIDPYNAIAQLSVPKNRLSFVQQIAASTSGLPPSGVLSNGSTNLFPIAPNGQSIGNV